MEQNVLKQVIDLSNVFGMSQKQKIDKENKRS